MIEKLSIKQKQFCDAYLANNGNATAAAISAGYSKSSAQQIGYENLKKQSIADYIGHLSNGNKSKPELKPEPERTVLKWTECIYGSRDTSSFPNHCENVLAIDCLGNYAVCCFDAGSRDFFLSHNDDEYFTEVVYWMLLPSQPSGIKPMQNDEYLIEQTTLETFDIIDAITPALREAVKHLLVQQGANK